MQPYPILLQPLLISRPWGGNQLATFFDFLHNMENNNGNEEIGEVWILSVCEQPSTSTKILNGSLANSSLSQIGEASSAWFEIDNMSLFPLFIKVLDTKEDLPVLVHVNDWKKVNAFKESQANTKFWYVLAADPDATVIYGHSAQSKSEFRDFLINEDWDNLFVKQSVKQGDFFYIPSGTLHALGKGVVVLEVEQGNTTPFCLYGQVDDSEASYTEDEINDRSLELEDAVKQINYPSRLPDVQPNVWSIGSTQLTRLVSSDYFVVEKWVIQDSFHFSTEQKFRFGFVIDGKGQLKTEKDTISLAKGNSFLLPAPLGEVELNGQCTMLIIYLPPNVRG